MSPQTGQRPSLDHIVILVSHSTLLGISDKLQDVFIVAPGGNHAGGLTSNKLVFLQDGTYIEFIAFFDDVDPERRRKHRWGNLEEGTIIDWAFTSPSGDDFDTIRQQVLDKNAGFSYEEPAAWGRKKADGTMLEWTLSAPLDSSGNALRPGRLPFWCFDKTPRHLRVPYNTEPHWTQHPSGVRGVSSLSVSVPSGQVEDLMKVYEVMCGPAIADRDWSFEVPSGSTGSKHTVSLTGSATEEEVAITLTLSGPRREQIEILPGLILEIE